MLAKILTMFSLGTLCFLNPGHGAAIPYQSEGFFKNSYGLSVGLISSFLPYNPVVLHAGAYVGTESVVFAKIWEKGKILAFEPNPTRFEKLVENTQAFANIKPFNMALNTYRGKAEFFLCYGTGGTNPIFDSASSLLAPTPQIAIHYQGPKIMVECVNLDEWCSDNQIDRIDFMRLDLQGLELQVLTSSPRILKTVKVIHVLTNLYPFRKGTTIFANLKAFLEKNGFFLIEHHYQEGLQGSAVFLQTRIFNGIYGTSHI